jgi:hypothetical protein
MRYALHDFSELLVRPVPDQAGPLSLKEGYRAYPLWPDHNLNNERVVDIAEYGIAGQAYYSRPNAATTTPVEGVKPTVYLRESMAKRLAAINTAIQQTDSVAKLLGGEVELYVEEGLRSVEIQRYLHGTLFPRLIREQNPGISDTGLQERRNQLIASPRRWRFAFSS